MDLDKLQKLVIQFRDERNWKQFHNPKDCAISLSLEAAEFLEHFQWKNEQELTDYLTKNKEGVADEMADILYWLLLISKDLDINLSESLQRKIKKNINKYPVEKSRNSHKKYTEL